MRLSALKAVPDIEAAIAHSKQATADLEAALVAAKKSAVPPTVLTNRMRIAGWSGPIGWRLQKYESKRVECVCCGNGIVAGTQHVSWSDSSLKDDAPMNHGTPRSNNAHGEFGARWADETAGRKWAHPECLHKLAQARCALNGKLIPSAYRVTLHQNLSPEARRVASMNLNRKHAADMVGCKWPEGLAFNGIEIPTALRNDPVWRGE